MKTNKSIGKLAGLLFLINLIPYVIANMGILDNLLYATDFPQNLGHNNIKIGVAVLLEFTSMTAMMAFAVLIFQIIRKINNTLSIIYLGLRFIEIGIITTGIIKLMSITSLSEIMLNSETDNLPYIQILADSMLSEYRWIGLIYMLVFGIHCIIFYALLFKSQLVPKFISVLGLVGTLLIFINMVSILFDLNFGGFFLFAPIGIVELILSLWLLKYGFKEITTNVVNE